MQVNTAYQSLVEPVGTTRNWEDEDAGPAPRPAAVGVTWDCGAAPADVALLLVGWGAGAVFLGPCVAEGSAGGEPAGRMTVGDSECALLKLAAAADGGGAVVVAIGGATPPAADEAAAWASALCAAAKPRRVAVLDGLPVHRFTTNEPERPSAPRLLRLVTPEQLRLGGSAPCETLRAPNCTDGVVAALLTRCTLDRVAASAYLSLQETAQPSADSLFAFAPALAACGLGRGDDDDGELRKQCFAAAAAAAAASSASLYL